MITSCGIFDQRTIKIITPTLCFPQVTQHSAQNGVVTAYEGFIIYLLKQYRAVRENAQCLAVVRGFAFNRCLAELLLLPLRRSE